jgi:hypothetical protein
MINVVFTVLILFVGIDSLVIIENPSPWSGRFRRGKIFDISFHLNIYI